MRQDLLCEPLPLNLPMRCRVCVLLHSLSMCMAAHDPDPTEIYIWRKILNDLSMPSRRERDLWSGRIMDILTHRKVKVVSMDLAIICGVFMATNTTRSVSASTKEGF